MNSTEQILCIKVSFIGQVTECSGVILVFFDKQENHYLEMFSITVLSDSLFKTDLSLSCKEIMKIILTAEKKYSVSPEKDHKLYEAFASSTDNDESVKIISNVESNDNAYVVNYLKNNLIVALNDEKIDLNFQNENISIGDYDELNVLNRIKSMTIAKKTDIAQVYFGNDKVSVEKSIFEMTNDVAVISYLIKSKINKSISGILFVNNLTGRIINNIAVYLTPGILQDYVIDQNPVDYFYRINNTREFSSGENIEADDFTTKIMGIDLAKLKAGIELKRPDKINSALSGLLNNAEYAIDSRISNKNVLIVNSLFGIKPYVAAVDKNKEDVDKKMKLIDVDLMLSPSKGKQVSTLNTGDEVAVLLDSSSEIGRSLIEKFQLKVENKIKPLKARIHEIKYNPDEGFVIYTSLFKNYFGKSVEEQDVRVRVLDTNPRAQSIDKSGKSIFLGLFSGLVVIILIIILLFVFKC